MNCFTTKSDLPQLPLPIEKNENVIRGEWKGWFKRQQTRVKINSHGEAEIQLVQQGFFSRIGSVVAKFLHIRSKSFGKKSPPSTHFTVLPTSIKGLSKQEFGAVLVRYAQKLSELNQEMKLKIEVQVSYLQNLQQKFVKGSRPFAAVEKLIAQSQSLLVSFENKEYFGLNLEKLKPIEEQFETINQEILENHSHWTELNEIDAREIKRQALIESIQNAHERLNKHIQKLQEAAEGYPKGSEQEKTIYMMIEEHTRTLEEPVPKIFGEGYVDALKKYVWNSIQQDKQSLEEIKKLPLPPIEIVAENETSQYHREAVSLLKPLSQEMNGVAAQAKSLGFTAIGDFLEERVQTLNYQVNAFVKAESSVEEAQQWVSKFNEQVNTEVQNMRRMAAIIDLGQKLETIDPLLFDHQQRVEIIELIAIQKATLFNEEDLADLAKRNERIDSFLKLPSSLEIIENELHALPFRVVNKKVEKLENAYLTACKEAFEQIYQWRKNRQFFNVQQMKAHLDQQKLRFENIQNFKENQVQAYCGELKLAKKSLEDRIDQQNDLSLLDQLDRLPVGHPDTQILRDIFLRDALNSIKMHVKALKRTKSELQQIWEDTKPHEWHEEVLEKIKDRKKAIKFYQDQYPETSGYLTTEVKMLQFQLLTPKQLREYGKSIEALIAKNLQLTEKDTQLSRIKAAQNQYEALEQTVSVKMGLLEQTSQFSHYLTLNELYYGKKTEFQLIKADLSSSKKMVQYAKKLEETVQALNACLQQIEAQGVISEYEQMKQFQKGSYYYDILHLNVCRRVAQKISDRLETEQNEDARKYLTKRLQEYPVKLSYFRPEKVPTLIYDLNADQLMAYEQEINRFLQ